MHCLGLKVDAPAPCKTRMANNTNLHCLGVIKSLKVKTLGTKVMVDVLLMRTKGEGYCMILGRPLLMNMKGYLVVDKTQKQQELDLKALEDKFSRDTTSRSKENVLYR